MKKVYEYFLAGSKLNEETLFERLRKKILSCDHLGVRGVKAPVEGDNEK